MTLYRFTPKGVEDKLESLYNLENELLLIEADSIELDFVGWMETNFNLNPLQKAYLNGIKEEVINYYGSQCALCFRHRLDIVLIYPTPIPGYAKYPETSNTIKVISDDQGNIEVTGSLMFTMIYRP
ncbi:hypothetical protein H1R17_09610 [Flavobacterium sp. xlx-214]|uniref:hypothetical protein n=1 Tax=unclassified Flavobacterium TaxID=196869 RepID=UPI0013D8DC23|nr:MULTISPECIES: hypothetical protein [unclassified Flavobacterium]MBA5793506.1 hypothetical protein [Flavobacterium sp. xlx-221]QMI82724.1 hypothetical protein H1R17_09610 [Flavobacterium sp. xlx-214]